MKKLLLFTIIAFISINGFAQLGLKLPTHETIVVKCEVFDSTNVQKNIVEEGINIDGLKNLRMKCDKLDGKRKYRFTITALKSNTEVNRIVKFNTLNEFNLNDFNAKDGDGLKIEVDIKDNFQSFSIPIIND